MLKTKTERLLALAVAFLAGCVASPLLVPPVRADTDPRRWEYACKTAGNDREATEVANKFGAAGWEIAAGAPDGQNALFCFKRPVGMATAAPTSVQ
jgi:hypothetical protein